VYTEVTASNKRAKRGDEDAETKDAASPQAPDTEKADGEASPSAAAADEKPSAAAATKDEKSSPTASAEDGKEEKESDNAAAARSALMMQEDLLYDSGFTTFPEKLMTLLDSGEVKDKMWWLSDGDAFCFIPDNFAETVLAQHFQGTKLESFTRKLNRW